MNPGTSGGDAFEWSNATSINMARYTPTLGVSKAFIELGQNWYNDLQNKQFLVRAVSKEGFNRWD